MVEVYSTQMWNHYDVFAFSSYVHLFISVNLLWAKHSVWINSRGADADGKLAVVRGKVPRQVLKLSLCLSSNAMTMNNNPAWFGSDVRIMPHSKECHLQLFDLYWGTSNPPYQPLAFCKVYWVVYCQNNSNLIISCLVLTY